MSILKYFQLLLVVLCAVFLHSCGSDACGDVTCMNDGVCVEGLCDCPEGFSGDDCGISCSEKLFGTWQVTDIRPVGCTLVSYTISAGSSAIIFAISLDDGTRVLTGQGLVNADCDEMSYSVSAPGAVEGGMIRFDGTTLTDQSSFGCLITAEKR